jgi:hypothetical protein
MLNCNLNTLNVSLVTYGITVAVKMLRKLIIFIPGVGGVEPRELGWRELSRLSLFELDLLK